MTRKRIAIYRKSHFAFHSRQEGLTLVEVLFALIITSFVALVIAKTTISASAALSRTSREVNTNLQVMNFSRNLRYDIAGSTDTYVFSSTAPTGQTRLCSSGGTSKWDIGVAGGVRTLFTVRVNELIDSSYVPSSTSAPSYIEKATGKWYGYEIRRPLAKESFQLWRVTCDETNAAPVNRTDWTGNEMLLVDLGKIDPSAAYGLNLFKCFPAEAGTFSCPLEASTTTKSYYQFTLPYFIAGFDTSSDKQLSAKLNSNYAGNNDLLKTLKRRIDKS